MILVDSSVWIDYFNGIINAQTDFLHELLPRDIVLIGDIVLTEVLQGFRSEKDYQTALLCFSAVTKVELAGIDICIKAAANYRQLLKKGKTIRKTIDCIIATACIEKKMSLLYSDKDFEPFLTLGLRSAIGAQG